MLRKNNFLIPRVLLGGICLVLFFWLGEKRLTEFSRVSYPANATPEIKAHSRISPSHPTITETFVCPLCQKKWLMTFTFSFAYFALSLLFIWLIFLNIYSIKVTLIIYCTLAITCILFLLYGFIIHDFSTGYRLANRIIGIIQSPFVVMFIIPVMKVYDVLLKGNK